MIAGMNVWCNNCQNHNTTRFCMQSAGLQHFGFGRTLNRCKSIETRHPRAPVVIDPIATHANGIIVSQAHFPPIWNSARENL